MGLTESVGQVLRGYANFTGRAGRPEFWWWYATLFVIGAAFAAVALFWGSGTTGDLLRLGYLVFWVALFLPTVAVAVRRLHDTNKSAWWLLLTFVPVVGNITLLVLMALPATPGGNTYGPPPTPAR